MTPVGLDDGTRDRKSEPCAFTARFALGATAMEAFENPFDLIGGYRVADIRDGETDAGCVRVNPDRDLPLVRRVAQGVRNQVRQGAPQHQAITLNARLALAHDADLALFGQGFVEIDQRIRLAGQVDRWP